MEKTKEGSRMKMNAVYNPEKGIITLREEEIQDPGPGQVQVRVHASVISPGTERAFILGLKNAVKSYPSYTGYGCAGEVIQTGEGVTRFQVGDRVIIGSGHRSHCNVGEHAAHAIPDGVSYKHAAFAFLGVISSLQGLRKARMETGEGVLVSGLGLVGQMALQLCKIAGGLPVIGTDLAENRLALAAACGADGVVNPGREDWREALAAHFDGKGPRVVLETSGAPPALAGALKVIDHLGRLVLVGCTREDTSVNFYSDVSKKGVQIIGAHNEVNPGHDSRPGYWSNREDIRVFMNLLKHHRLALDPLITDEVSWKDSVEVFQRMLVQDTDMMAAVLHWQD